MPRTPRSPRFVAAAALVALFVTATAALAAPGDLDPTFGDGTGRSRFGAEPGNSVGAAVAVQSDGKVVVAGTARVGTASEICLARFNTDGSYDATFGVGGVSLTRTLPEGFIVAALRIQSDGRLVVAGSCSAPNGTTGFAAARFLDNGTLDTSFDGNGYVVTTFYGYTAAAQALAVQSDGRLVLAGYATDIANFDFALVRYNTDGSLDTSFDGDGSAQVDMFSPEDVGKSVMIQADGKIVVAGYSVPNGQPARYAVARLGTSGALDNTFDGDGRAFCQVTNLGDYGAAVARQNGGGVKPDKIVVAGQSYTGSVNAISAVRLNLDGTLDATFDGDGKVLITPAGRNTYVSGLEITIDRNQVASLYVSGTSNVGTIDGDFTVAKLTSAGALDATFDGDGLAFTPGSWPKASAAALRVTSGAPWVAGTAYVGAYQKIALAHFTNTGAMDTAFTGTGTVDLNPSLAPLDMRAVGLRGGDRLVVAGGGGQPRAPFEVIGCQANGTVDPAYGTNGVAAGTGGTPGTANALLVLPGDTLLVAGNVTSGSTVQGAVARYRPDGSLDPTFGTGGVVTLTGADNKLYLNALTRQPDGHIVLAGGLYVFDPFGSYTKLMVVRLNPNGTPDTSFGPGGRRYVTEADQGQAVAVDAAGRIVVAATRSGQTTIYRFTPTGLLDTAFNGFGWVQVPTGTASTPVALLLQSDARIVIAGTTSTAFGDNTTLIRLTQNGTPDPTFGSSGISTRDLNVATDRATGLVRQPDGHFLVSGYIDQVTLNEGFFLTDSQFIVSAWLPDGGADTSYGTYGMTVVDVGGQTVDQARGLVLDGSNRAVVAGGSGGLAGLIRLQPGAVSGVPVEMAPAPMATLGPPVPNPSRSGARLVLEMREAAAVSVVVVDAGGRLVRRLVSGETLAAGTHALLWDGRDVAGLRAPAGVYFLRAETGTTRKTQQLVVAR